MRVRGARSTVSYLLQPIYHVLIHSHQYLPHLTPYLLTTSHTGHLNKSGFRHSLSQFFPATPKLLHLHPSNPSLLVHFTPTSFPTILHSLYNSHSLKLARRRSRMPKMGCRSHPTRTRYLKTPKRIGSLRQYPTCKLCF